MCSLINPLDRGINFIEKLRQRHVKKLVHDYRTCKGQSQDLNAGSLSLCPTLDCLELLQRVNNYKDL